MLSLFVIILIVLNPQTEEDYALVLDFQEQSFLQGKYGTKLSRCFIHYGMYYVLLSEI